MTALRMLQVCNVGRIVGGTAACAWTVVRALPEFEHRVAFLSDITSETQSAFGAVRVERWSTCSADAISRARADVVILHNVFGRESLGGQAVTIQYVHSSGVRAPADLTVYCSRWLAARCGGEAVDVLYQGVPKPSPPGAGMERDQRQWLVIGRLCTPIVRKWPACLVELYEFLASRFPGVWWEFVGCPCGLQSRLQAACRGRASFVAPGWQARRRLWSWDALLYHHPGLTESFGRTVAEGMRAGCVPIVDARGGFVEQVPGEAGFLCASREEFAAGIDRLHDRKLRRHMSEAARTHADRMFSIARFRVELRARLLQAAGC